jgi:hypothetical protein
MKKKKNVKVDPERKMALESLPPNVRNSLNSEEVEMFLHAETWPESLFKKLKEFIV